MPQQINSRKTARDKSYTQPMNQVLTFIVMNTTIIIASLEGKFCRRRAGR
jgi:hypothetical protein